MTERTYKQGDELADPGFDRNPITREWLDFMQIPASVVIQWTAPDDCNNREPLSEIAISDDRCEVSIRTVTSSGEAVVIPLPQIEQREHLKDLIELLSLDWQLPRFRLDDKK
jgi:hypothetical protein